MSMPSINHPDLPNRQADAVPGSVLSLRPVASPQPLRSIRASLFAHVATMSLEASLKAETPSRSSDLDDPALIVGLALWTARQHERYLAAAEAAAAAADRDNSRVLHRYPTILADTLRCHADDGDPTCRLVLDWLTAKGLVEPGPAASADKGAV